MANVSANATGVQLELGYTNARTTVRNVANNYNDVQIAAIKSGKFCPKCMTKYETEGTIFKKTLPCKLCSPLPPVVSHMNRMNSEEIVTTQTISVPTVDIKGKCWFCHLNVTSAHERVKWKDGYLHKDCHNEMIKSKQNRQSCGTFRFNESFVHDSIQARLQNIFP